MSDEELKKRFDQTANGNIYLGPESYATVLYQRAVLKYLFCIFEELARDRFERR